MKNLYYITRSFPPIKTGGALMREAQVNELKKYFNVIVYTLGYNGYRNTTQVINHIDFKVPLKVMNVFEKMGIIEDHLREWGDRTIKALKQCVKKDDIILATTGGELECLRIAFKLKNVIGCPAFVFYHDPIDYVKYDGMVLDNKFHICRDKYENKYLEKMDGIFVSSEKFKKCLTQKYPGLKNKIYLSYLGYPIKYGTNQKNNNKDFVNIVYAGNFAKAQSPEMLYYAFKILNPKIQKKVKITYVGDVNDYAPLTNLNYPNVCFVKFLPREEYYNWMVENADIGFVPLANNYLGFCVPSKIYECINMEIPILGALPDGDAKQIVEKYDLGLTCSNSNINELSEIIMKICDKELLKIKKENLRKVKDHFSLEYMMGNTIIPKLINF